LANVHPGDVLREDFLIGCDISVAEVAEKTGLGANTLQALLDGTTSVTADLDLRLGAYLGMSQGFFLRLQNAFDLEEAQRSAGAEIGRIRPRAEHAA
jgi:addiction module HigA family antidote